MRVGARPGRGRRRRVGSRLAAAAVVVLAGACSVEATTPPPDCVEGGSALIVAQSVPTASQIPCLDGLPRGWTVAGVVVDQDHTRVELDSDRAGEGAAVLRLEESCDTSGAVPASSDLPPAERFDRIERLVPGLRASVYYVIDGGCVWWRFDFDDGTSATAAVAAGEALSLVPRTELQRSLAESFIDEEL